jgi:hypothetical protein
MKLKAVFLALAVAGIAASFGLTDTGRSETGTGTVATTTTTPATTASTGDCKRFELRGSLATVSASSFSATVAKGSKAAKALAGTAATFAVTADTRVSWSGRGTFAGPNVGDTVRVNGKQCGGPAGALTALRVDARTPKAADKKPDSDAKKGEKSHK